MRFLSLTHKTSHSIWTLTLLSVFIILPLTLKSPSACSSLEHNGGKKKGTAWLKVKGARYQLSTCTEGKNHTDALYCGELLKCQLSIIFNRFPIISVWTNLIVTPYNGIQENYVFLIGIKSLFLFADMNIFTIVSFALHLKLCNLFGEFQRLFK